MQRRRLTPRPDWKEKVSYFGFEHHSYSDGMPYWDESGYYSISQLEADNFYSLSQQLYRALIDLGTVIVEGQRYDQLGIPLGAIPLIARSWDADDPTLLCRLDFVYDGTHPPRLFELHADTPGMLLESAHVQWGWKEECFPELGQFNSIYETILDTYREYGFHRRAIHFTSQRRGVTPQFADVELLRTAALEMGARARHIKLSEIDWDDLKGRFVDQEREPIELLVKLYPWEWLLSDRFGEYVLNESMVVVEPAWKMLYANQAIMAMLTRSLPDEENIVPFSLESFGKDRESLPNFRPRTKEAFSASNLGTRSLDFADIPFVYRRKCLLPSIDGNYPLISCWLIGGHPAGLAIRENERADGLGRWRFVPHVIA